MMQEPLSMSHEERAKRRTQIIEYVRKGHTLADAVNKFNLKLGTVRDLCRTAGVIVKQQRPPMDESTYEIIASMVLERGTLQFFADKHGVSRQRIHQIREKCINAGIPLGIGSKIGHVVKKVEA